MNNHLEIFQKNDREIVVGVVGLSDLSPYTSYLSVKKKTTDPSTLLFKAGVTDPSTLTFVFSLTSTDTSLNVADYAYDVTIVGNGKTLTIARDILSILDNCYA